MEVKKIVEGMTAVEVAEVIDSNFKNQNKILEEDIATQNSLIGVSEYKDFSEAEAMNVGDVRKYEGFLYECVEATTGAFDASKWKKSSFKAETEKKLSELGSYVSNPEYARAYIDAEGRFLWGIKYDGSIEWSKGIPKPIKEHLKSNFVKLSNPILRERISIIGDSISTYNQEGYNIDGYTMYYPNGDVDNVDDTWWKQFINLTQSKLDVNASYSGSTSSSKVVGFSSRVPLLGNPSLILIALGTNDSWQKIPIGSIDFDSDNLDESLFANSYVKGMQTISETYPFAKVICLSFAMEDEYADAIKTIAEYFNAAYIDVREEAGEGHPNESQMSQVCNSVVSSIIVDNLLLNKIAAKDNKVLNGTFNYISNPEWACAIVDAEEHILMGIKTDGSFYIPNRDMYHVESNPEYAKVVVDGDGRVVFGIKVDGSCYIPKGISEEAKKGLIELTARISWFETDENPEWLQVTTDSEGRMLEGIGNDGKKYFPKQEMLEKYNDIEGRTEMTLDADGKILSYRDGDGVKHETKMSISDKLSLGVGAMSDLQKALRESGFNVENPVDWSKEKAISLPKPRYCARVNIISETGLATTKTQDKKCVLQYWDKSGNYFQKYVILNAQGSSSMSYKEKNQSIDVFNDENCKENCDITFGDWVAQDSFHLKCYYIDVYRGMANFCYNYVEDVIKHIGCRSNRKHLDVSNTTYRTGVGDFDKDFNDKALCHPDGFPFEMYVNGEYYGLFAWNLKKHRKNYSMNKNDYKSILLDGTISYTRLWGGVIDWTGFELRNPKELVTMDGREYDADYNCNELIDESSEYYDVNNSIHVNTAKTKNIIIKLSQAIPRLKGESDIDEAKIIFESNFDKQMMIVYLIVSNVLGNYDGFAKNWIWTIFEGIAAPNFYDMDSCFGRYHKGNSLRDGADINSSLGVSTDIPTGQLNRLYSEEIKSTYKELRDSGIISVDKIMTYVYGWIGMVGISEIKRNVSKWTPPSYRNGYVNNEYWMIEGNVEDVVDYDSSRIYNVGEYCFYGKFQDNGVKCKCIKQCQGVPPLTRFYDDVPYEGGFYDTPERIKLWLMERISFLDSLYQYV